MFHDSEFWEILVQNIEQRWKAGKYYIVGSQRECIEIARSRETSKEAIPTNYLRIIYIKQYQTNGVLEQLYGRLILMKEGSGNNLQYLDETDEERLIKAVLGNERCSYVGISSMNQY